LYTDTADDYGKNYVIIDKIRQDVSLNIITKRRHAPKLL